MFSIFFLQKDRKKAVILDRYKLGMYFKNSSKHYNTYDITSIHTRLIMYDQGLDLEFHNDYEVRGI